MLKEALNALRTSRTFALVGASAEPGKYGHKVFSTLKDDYRLMPVNLKRSDIEGVRCYPSYADLPEKPDGVIVALSPAATEALVAKLVAAAPALIWLPPECFTDASVDICRTAGVSVIYDICPVAALATLKRLNASSEARQEVTT